MRENNIPIFGYAQPKHETLAQLSSNAMSEKAKKDGKRGSRPPSANALRLRRTFAENLAALIELRYPLKKYTTNSAREKAVAKDSGVSWSSIQRKLDADDAATLDLLADIASAFIERPFDLLDPDFGDKVKQRLLAQAQNLPSSKRQDAA